MLSEKGPGAALTQHMGRGLPHVSSFLLLPVAVGFPRFLSWLRVGSRKSLCVCVRQRECFLFRFGQIIRYSSLLSSFPCVDSKLQLYVLGVVEIQQDTEEYLNQRGTKIKVFCESKKGEKEGYVKRGKGVREGTGPEGERGGNNEEKGARKHTRKTLILVPHMIQVLFSGLLIFSRAGW